MFERAGLVSVKSVQPANEVPQFLERTFFSRGDMRPKVIDDDTNIVANVVKEVGIRSWINAVRRFDDATRQHCLLVAGLAAAFGSVLGLNGVDSQLLTKDAPFNDVGKIEIPVVVLNKPGEVNIKKVHDAYAFCARTYYVERMRVRAVPTYGGPIVSRALRWFRLS